MLRVLFVLFGLVAAQAIAISSASAQQGHDACVRDVARFCRSHMNDDDQTVLACLKQHRGRLSKACDKVLSTDPERRVDVSWDVHGDFRRPVTVRILTADRPGLLAEISSTFSGKGVNISQANCRSTGDERAVATFEVSISDVQQLNECLATIERIHGVLSVERVGRAE